jgi:hypothetical protein
MFAWNCDPLKTAALVQSFQSNPVLDVDILLFQCQGFVPIKISEKLKDF